MRIGIDGERGFSLGVDTATSSWLPKKAASSDSAAAPDEMFDRIEAEMRINFMRIAPWDHFLKLLEDSGMLCKVSPEQVGKE
jgi:hypothetical protein